MYVDATRIYPGLWQGSFPPFGPFLKAAGFRMVVLCAEEFQPPFVLPPDYGFEHELQGLGTPYEGIEIVYAPNDDSNEVPPSRDQLRTAIRAASRAADAIRGGGEVLVTCWAGKNRSGLVSALTLHKLLGISGQAAVRVIQNKRHRALRNPFFLERLYKIPSAVHRALLCPV